MELFSSIITYSASFWRPIFVMSRIEATSEFSLVSVGIGAVSLIIELCSPCIRHLEYSSDGDYFLACISFIESLGSACLSLGVKS